MPFIEKDGLRYFQFRLFEDQFFFHGVFTRHGGISKGAYRSLNTGGTVGDDPEAVLENHHRIYQTTGFDFASRYDVWQVHGRKILTTQSPRPMDTSHPKADGILTNAPDVSLFMRFADCVPVLLADPQHQVIGIVHAGWQGTQSKIARAAVETMTTEYGTDPAVVLAGIGPSICQSCYQVGPEVHYGFLERFGSGAEGFFERRQGCYYLDLWKANVDTLQEAGVRQIEVAGICTACNLQDWYSHRAENGRTGRFAVLMALLDNK